MEIVELMKLTKEVGLSVGIFGLCAWMVVFIVKRLSLSMDKLITELKFFMGKVKDEHAQSGEEHKALMTQHQEITKQQAEITGALGRLNGKVK